MTMSLMPPRKKRPLLLLQLTAMIDIFSLIVIFLIKGTVFGETDISVPEKMKLPRSVSKESIQNAPRVTIDSTNVSISALGKTLPLALFRPQDQEPAQLIDLKAKLKQYVSKLPKDVWKSGVLLNVVADQHAPYRDIFDTVRVLRQCGFETILFIAMEETKK